MKFFIIAVLNVFLLFSCSSSKKCEKKMCKKESKFKKKDLNSDGYISKEEWKMCFDKKDANKDKKLTVDELVAYKKSKGHKGCCKKMKKCVEKKFKKMDLNNDDVVTLKEWNKKFMKKDMDKDGKISLKEYSTKCSSGSCPYKK